VAQKTRKEMKAKAREETEKRRLTEEKKKKKDGVPPATLG